MLMEELKRRDSETEEEYKNRIAEYRREMKEEEEEDDDDEEEEEEEEEEQEQEQEVSALQPTSTVEEPLQTEIEERKRSFSDRQKILEEKKIQQQREEAERTRIEEEKRIKKDAKRRERKERERRESMRIQKLEEQNKSDFVSYYGPNFSVHPALTTTTTTNRGVNKPPPPVIRQEYDAFSEGMTPERIIGATDELGELSFLVKWKGTDEADFVPAKKAKLHCPELVIRFYEGIIAWK